MPDNLPNAYDLMPYESLPFPQSQPDRLAAVAALFGLEPTPVERGRILEIGCASGGNLLPLAARYPHAEWVGVDLSAVQIAAGRELAAAAGLANVQLVEGSFTTLPDDLGSFDYVIAHGIFSWIDDTLQQAMLRFCAERLAPQGVAYISYNTYPGWRMRGIVRDMMRYHLSSFDNPSPALAVQQARAMLQFAAGHIPDPDSPYARHLQAEMSTLAAQPDYYLFHDHLEAENRPLYFHEFMAQAAGVSLQYLGETELSTMFASNFPAEVAETVLRIAPDIVRAEQYMDFLRNRMFRQTLLCHGGYPLRRALTPDLLQRFHLASPFRPDSATPDLFGSSVEGFHTPTGATLSSEVPVVKAALVALAAHWPLPITYPSLLADTAARLLRPLGGTEEATLAEILLRTLVAGVLEIWTTPPTFTLQPGKLPMVAFLARKMARRGARVTNERHETVLLDPVGCELLPLLDGTHGREDLLGVLRHDFRSGRLVLQQEGAPVQEEAVWEAQLAPTLDAALDKLARSALLIA